MAKPTCDPRRFLGQAPGVDERLRNLRRRRTALARLIESLTSYAECAGLESEPGDALPRLYTLSGADKGQDA